MARPAKNDFIKDEARRFRDGVRDLCDWLGIAVADLRFGVAIAGHGERPTSWVYNALKHDYRALTRDTAQTLLVRVNARAWEAASSLAPVSRRQFQRDWQREKAKRLPTALTKKLAGRIVPVPAFIEALHDAFRERNAGKVAVRLSALMSPRSKARRVQIHSQLRAWFETLYEPAAKNYLEQERQRGALPDPANSAQQWINPKKIPASNKTHCRQCGCMTALHLPEGCKLCRARVRRNGYCV